MAEQCCTPTFFSFLMYSSRGDSRADYSICCIVRPLKVMTSRQEDHPNYASGPLIMPSRGLFRLSLTLITSVFGGGGVCSVIIISATDGARRQGILDIGLCGWWGSRGRSSGGLQPKSCWRGRYVKKPTSAIKLLLLAPSLPDSHGNTCS